MKIFIPFLLVFQLLTSTTFGQSYQSWLDSISSPDYIANEYWMEELIYEASDSTQQYVNNLVVSATDNILEKTEGVWMIKRGAYAAEPVIRGLTGNRVMVTLDGMRIKSACTDKMDPATSYIEPNNLEKIDIIKGGNGIIHGNSIGGLMDFKIKKPVFNDTYRFSGKAEARYNSVSNGFENLALINYSANNLAILGGITYRKNNDYVDGSGETIAHSGFNKVNYNFSISKKSTNSLLNFSFIGDRAWDVGYPSLPMDVAHANANIFSLEYNHWAAEGFFNDYLIKLYYNEIDHLMDDSGRDVEVRMDMPGQSSSTGGFFSAGKNLRKNMVFKIRADVNYSYLLAEMTMYAEENPPMYMLTWPEIQMINSGLNGGLAINTFKNWNINIGARAEFVQNAMLSELGQAQFSVFGYDDFNKTFITFAGNAEVKRTLKSNWFVTMNLAYSERAPDESEQYGFYLFNSQDAFDYIGNPNINKEKSYQFQASTGIKKGSFSAELNYFNYYIDQYIFAATDSTLSGMTPGSKGVRAYENIDYATYQGMEMSIRYINNKWNISSNAKYTRANDNNGIPLPLIPPLKWMNSISYSTAYGFSAQIDLNYSSPQYQVNTELEEDTTPGFLITNLHLQQKFLQKKRQDLVLQAGIENLTNEMYHEHLDWNNLPRPGRNIYVGVKYRF